MGRLGRSTTHSRYSRLLARYILFIINCLALSDEDRHFSLPDDTTVHAQNLRAALATASSVYHSSPNTTQGEDDDDTAVEEEEDDDDVDDPQYDIPGDETNSGSTEVFGTASGATSPPATPSDPFRPWEVDNDDAYIAPLLSDDTVLPLIHRLLFALFTQPSGIKVGMSQDPLVVFTVLENLTDDNTFKPIEGVPPMLAQLQYSIRMCIICEIMTAESTTTQEDVLSWVKLSKPDSPFTFIRTTLSKVSKVVLTMSTRSRFHNLAHDGSLFEFDGQKIHVRSIIRMVQAMLATLEHRIMDLLARAGVTMKDLPEWALLQKIQDDVGCKKRGYSLFEDPDNNLEKYRTLLLLKFSKMDGFGTLMSDSTPDIIDPAWMDLSAEIKDITELLLACCHLMCGAVARGTSIAAETWRNPPWGRRNFCWSGGVGAFFSGHAKSSHALGYDLVIVRTQPQRLSFLTFIYLLVIRPLDLTITSALKLHSTPSVAAACLQGHFYLFWTQGERLSPRHLRRILRLWTRKYLGVAYGISQIRQIWCFLKDYFVQEHRPYLADLADWQYGHNPKQARQNYGVTYRWAAPNAADTATFKRISEEYHRVLGISGNEMMDLESE